MNSTNKRNRSLLFIPVLAMLALLALAATQQPILRLLLQQDADGGGNSFTNLNTVKAAVGYFDDFDGPGTNRFGTGGGSFLNSSNYVNKVGTEIFAVNGTNVWWDFGLTNNAGPIVYQTLIATNNVNFLGTTNVNIWGLLSMNVVASGADRTLSIPTNLPHLNTNGLIIGGSTFRLVLTNGNEFRITLQSNVTLSTLWTTFGQGAPSQTNGFATPTNSSVNGYVVTASGAQSKWMPGTLLTNTPTAAGQVPISTSSGTAAWGNSSGGGGGSNSVIEPIYVYPPGTDFNNRVSSSGTWLIYWSAGDNQLLRILGGGPYSFQLAGDWRSSSPGQIETHHFILANGAGGTASIGFTPTNNWQFMSEVGGYQTGPTSIPDNTLIFFTIRHIGGQSNFLVNAQSFTNAEAPHF